MSWHSHRGAVCFGVLGVFNAVRRRRGDGDGAGLRTPSTRHRPRRSEEEIVGVLHEVCEKERLTLPDELAARIAKASGRNLRRAILALEECKVAQYPFDASMAVPQPDWEVYIKAIAQDICREQSPARLVATRDKLYELLAKCIPADVILKELCAELVSKLDDELKPQVMACAAFYEHRVQQGSKEIFHLEAFVAKFMVIYKKFMDAMFA